MFNIEEGIMKRHIILIILLACSLVYAKAENRLNDIYKKGSVHIKRELSIEDESLPKGVFLLNPLSLDIDANGNVYICDQKANDVKVFDGNGSYLRTIGRQGQGPGEFNWPEKICVSVNRLFVWEYMHRRLSILSLNGEFIKSINFSWQEGLPSELKPLPDGRLIIERIKPHYDNVEFPQECLIELYSSDGDYLKTIYKRNEFRTKLITRPGRTEVPQPFNPRTHWEVSPAGKIIIGHSSLYKIDVYDPEKGLLFSFSHKHHPVKITAEDKKKHFSNFTVGFVKDGVISRKRGATSFITENTQFPEFKPAFNSILTDSEGNIWVHVFLENREEENNWFDVFDAQGRFLNKVKICGDIAYPFYRTKIINNYFWMIDKNEEGFVKISKYKII